MPDNDNPYVGPVPFEENQRQYFFGREEESETLLSKAIVERVVLFYSQSGAGKSSLINAELVPRLREKEYLVLPVARVGGDLPDEINAAELGNIYVFNTLWCLLKDKKKHKLQSTKSLKEFFDESQWTNETTPHWLVIDQFEEILTTYPGHSDQRQEFFQQLRELLEADPLLSIVLAMREDHIAGLDNYAAILPGRLTSRFRMERLKRDAALRAIQLPAQKAGRPFDRGVAEELVADLSRIRVAENDPDAKSLTSAGASNEPSGDYVEPMQLQIVCHALWKNLSPGGQKITHQDRVQFGNVDKALGTFYDGAIERVATETNLSPVTIRRWFGETLITPTRIRAQVNRSFLTSGGLPNKAVDLFLNEHLIRVEEARGGKWYELSHDRLIAPILESNEKWLMQGGQTPLSLPARIWHEHKEHDDYLFRGRRLREAQKWYEKNKGAPTDLEKAFLESSMNAEAKRSSRLKSAITLLVFLLVCALAGTSFALFQWRRSVKVREELLSEQMLVKSTNIALDAQQTELIRRNALLDQQRADLDEALKNAESERKKAEDNQKIAEDQRQIAIRQKQQILNQREIVEKAEERVKEASKLLPEHFIAAAHDYARRVGLRGADPTIFFVKLREGHMAQWNTQKRQYEVSFDHVNSRGLAEYVAIEGRFMAKHFDKCFGGNRDSPFDFWNSFRYGLTEYLLVTEPQLSGEGKMESSAFDAHSKRLLNAMREIQKRLGNDAQPVRALVLALLDQYECNWSESNILANTLKVNRGLGKIPEQVIRDAFALNVRSV